MHIFGFVENFGFEVSLEIMPMTFVVLSQIIVPLLRSKLSALNWQNIFSESVSQETLSVSLDAATIYSNMSTIEFDSEN